MRWKRSFGLVEHDREEEPEREREQHGQAGEDERPDEDADERVADERVVDDAAKLSRPIARAPARLELLAAGRDERAAVVVAKDDPVVDPGERVGGAVVAKRRLQLERRVESLGPDRPVAADGDRVTPRAAGRARATGRCGNERRTPPAPQVTSPFSSIATEPEGASSSPSLVPTNPAPDSSSKRTSTSVPSASRAGRHQRTGTPSGDSASEFRSIPCDRLALRQDVSRRPVREGDVDVVDDRRDLEREQEDRAGDQELEREEPARRQVDRVDRHRRHQRTPSATHFRSPARTTAAQSAIALTIERKMSFSARPTGPEAPATARDGSAHAAVATALRGSVGGCRRAHADVGGRRRCSSDDGGGAPRTPHPSCDRR